MWVKGFKKAIAALPLVVFLAAVACAAPAGSALIGGAPDVTEQENSLEHVLENGIRITVEGVRRNDARVPWTGTNYHNISLLFRITAPEDTTIRIDAQNIYDNAGNEFIPGFHGNIDSRDRAVLSANIIIIGGQDVSERLVVTDVPTLVEIVYQTPEGYSLTSVFPRVSLAVNRQTVIFRNVPSLP